MRTEKGFPWIRGQKGGDHGLNKGRDPFFMFEGVSR